MQRQRAGTPEATDLPLGGGSIRVDARRNRDAIVASASRAFSERGVEASLEDIARDAGVGSATLHRHFPTREALIASVYRRDIDELCADVNDQLDQHPADEALAEWMRQAVRRTIATRGMAAALKAAACDAEEFHDIRITIRSTITRLMTPAAEQALIRRDIAAHEILRALGGFCLFDDQPDAEAQALRLVDLLVDGLRFGAQDAHAR